MGAEPEGECAPPVPRPFPRTEKEALAAPPPTRCPPGPHTIPLKPGMGGSRRSGDPRLDAPSAPGARHTPGHGLATQTAPWSPLPGGLEGPVLGLASSGAVGGRGLSSLAGGRRASHGGGAVLGSGVQWGAGGAPAVSPSTRASIREGPLRLSNPRTPAPCHVSPLDSCVPFCKKKVTGLPGVSCEGRGWPVEPPLLWPGREPRGLPLTPRLGVSKALDTRSVVVLTSACEGKPARTRPWAHREEASWVLGAAQPHGAREAVRLPSPSRRGHGGQRAAP